MVPQGADDDDDEEGDQKQKEVTGGSEMVSGGHDKPSESERN